MTGVVQLPGKEALGRKSVERAMPAIPMCRRHWSWSLRPGSVATFRSDALFFPPRQQATALSRLSFKLNDRFSLNELFSPVLL